MRCVNNDNVNNTVKWFQKFLGIHAMYCCCLVVCLLCISTLTFLLISHENCFGFDRVEGQWQ